MTLPAYCTLRHKRDGVAIDEYSDLLSIEFTRVQNGYGDLRIGLLPTHRALIAGGSSEFLPGDHVEVWRTTGALIGGLPRRIFSGFLLDIQVTLSGETGDDEVFLLGVEDEFLLWTRVVAFHAAHHYGSLAETEASEAMRLLVETNIGDLATVAEGRFVDGGTPYTVQIADQGVELTALSSPWDVYYQPLGDALRTIGQYAGLDFDISPVPNAAGVWEFKVTLASTPDHTSIVFAPEFGNVAEIAYETRFAQTPTILVGGGPGTGGDRTVLTSQRDPFVQQFGGVEAFYPFRTAQSVEALAAEVEAQMQAFMRRAREITFTPEQNRVLWPDDYDLGSVVRARYWGVEQQRKITQVSYAWEGSNGAEDIAIESVSLDEYLAPEA